MKSFLNFSLTVSMQKEHSVIRTILQIQKNNIFKQFLMHKYYNLRKTRTCRKIYRSFLCFKLSKGEKRKWSDFKLLKIV